MTTLVLSAPPASEPLTIAEAKLHLRVDESDEDELLSALIIAARQAAEARTARALMPQTWQLFLPSFPLDDAALRLPRPPFISLTSIVYADTTGVQQTMDEGAYTLVRDRFFTAMRPAFGTLWPTTRVVDNAVCVTFQAGYAGASVVPEPIKAWMKIMIGTLYAHREIGVIGQKSVASFVPRGFSDGLLDPYIVPAVA